MPPTVSINLCCYNSEKYLRETLDSIVNQTFSDWELIIINDGSIDSTEHIINEYIEHGYTIIYHYQENKGLGISRNEALKRSSGEFIAFIDHDDIWLPQKLEKQVRLFKKNLRLGLLYCNAIQFHQATGKKFLHLKRKSSFRGNAFENLMCHYILSMPTVIIRRRCLDSLHQWFDERLTLVEEVDLFIRIAHDWEVDYIDEVLAIWRMHGDSLTWTMEHLFGKEWKILLEKYKNLYPEFSLNHRRGIKRIEARIAYYDALEDWKAENKRKARQLIVPHIINNPKLLFVYMMMFFTFSRYTTLLRFVGKYV